MVELQAKGERASGPLRVSRRTALGMLGAAGAGLTLAACGQSVSGTSATPSASSTGKTTVTYWTFASSADAADNPRARSQQLILEEFRRRNPDIEVVEEVVPWQELQQQLIRAVATGRAPDVTRQIDINIQSLAEAGAIESLDDYVADWDDARRDDYVYAWDDTVFSGQKFAFRQAVRPSNLLYYRTDIYEESGFSQPPRTEAEFTEIIKATSGGSLHGWIIPLSKADNLANFMQHVPPMLWGLGADIIDPATSRPTFQEQPGIQVMQWLQDLVHEHGAVPKGVTTMDSEAVDQQFLGGVIGSIFANTAKHGQWSSAEGVQGSLGYAGFPNWSNDASLPGPANNAGAWTLTMSKGAKRDAAWRLMEWFQSPEAELIDAQVGGEIPTRTSTLDDPWFDEEEAGRIGDYLEWMSANPHEATSLKIRDYPAFVDALGDAVQRIISQQADVEETLGEAAERYERGIA